MASQIRLKPISAYAKVAVLLATAGPHVGRALAAPIESSGHERTPPGSKDVLGIPGGLSDSKAPCLFSADYLLGESHGTVYKKAELKTLVGIHGHIGEEMLNEDEVTIISAVLELGGKSVSAIMTPIEDTYVLDTETVLDRERVDEILALGHSRIPIHVAGKPQEFVGMLIVKKNPGVDGHAIGVVTLEDVIEEMIGEGEGPTRTFPAYCILTRLLVPPEIVDETDIYVDVQQKIKVVRGPNKRAAGKALAPLIQGVIERRKAFIRRPTTEYGAIKDGSAPKPQPIPKAFSKVKLRGGGEPERRSDLVDRIETREQSRAPSPEGREGRPGANGNGNGERTPLLDSRASSMARSPSLMDD
ncbi:hypothetical protein P7C70_g7930, partial [Phenoliferia sp. Uapishka_3]